MNEESIDQFQKIFSGNTDRYGLYGNFPNGKKYKTVHKPPTKELYKQHLEGKISLGIVPIRHDNKCKFGALDLDDHKKGGIKKGFDYEFLLKKIKFLKLPLIVFKSKSGGAHAYLFLQEWVPAIDVRHILKKMAYALGYERGTVEIFPKQDKLEPADSGNYINLPYHAGNTRVAVTND